MRHTIQPQPDPLQFTRGARTLGDLASRVIDGLALSFAHHATSVAQADYRNASPETCGEKRA
jgi:hypothetical protein